MKTILLTLLLALLLIACDGLAPYEDLEGLEVADPDKAFVIRNADQFPNFSVLCFDGAAIISTTREAAPVIHEDSHFCDDGVLE